MKTRFVVLLVLFLGFGQIAQAQKFNVPENYGFNDDSDFQKYQPELLKAIDWFEHTPWDQQRFKKQEVVDFIMAWIEGCPYVTVETSDDINKLGNADNDLLIMYFSGYARYLLQNPTQNSKNDARMAGMKALLAKYERDKVFIKDKTVEKLAKLDSKGGLQAWLANELDD